MASYGDTRMTTISDWLPSLVLLRDYGGDWEQYINAVYQYFKNDFIDSKPKYDDKVVQLKRHPLFQDKEYSFWHVTSEGEEEEERTPDIRRCERIRWPRPIIEHYCNENVRCWPNKRGRDKRIVLWLFNEDYVVVLTDRKKYVLLWTAYMVSYRHTKEKLLKEYEEYHKIQKPPQ